MAAKKDQPSVYRKANVVTVGDVVQAEDGSFAPVAEVIISTDYGYKTYWFALEAGSAGQAFTGGQYVTGRY